MDLYELGHEIKKARKEKKITLLALAGELNMSVATLSRLETGSIDEIGIRKVMRVMDRLGLELSTRPAHFGYTFEDAQKDNAVERSVRSGQHIRALRDKSGRRNSEWRADTNQQDNNTKATTFKKPKVDHE